MNFIYRQSTGEFLRGDTVLATGYSGNGAGLNNPAMQNVRMHGPLPRGTYTIQRPSVHPKLGPVAMELLPYSTNQMFLRGDFFLHGDNSQMNHTASDGCIILPHGVRTAVAEDVINGKNLLKVTL